MFHAQYLLHRGFLIALYCKGFEKHRGERHLTQKLVRLYCA
jgi:hypothetical protein